MYQVTLNQKERLLNDILKLYENPSEKGSVDDKDFLLSEYHKVQRLSQGASLSNKEALRLKKLIGKESSKCSPQPIKGLDK